VHIKVRSNQRSSPHHKIIVPYRPAIMMMGVVVPQYCRSLLLIWSLVSTTTNMLTIGRPGLDWPGNTDDEYENGRQRRCIEERRGGGVIVASAFSMTMTRQNEKSSSLSNALTTATYAPAAERRRDFLARMIGGGGIVVVATTTALVVAPSSARAAMSPLPLPAAVEAADSRNNNSTSAQQQVMVSKGGRKFGALANRIRAMGNIMVRRRGLYFFCCFIGSFVFIIIWPGRRNGSRANNKLNYQKVRS
jgi:hypothetical protein